MTLPQLPRRFETSDRPAKSARLSPLAKDLADLAKQQPLIPSSDLGSAIQNIVALTTLRRRLVGNDLAVPPHTDRRAVGARSLAGGLASAHQGFSRSRRQG